MGLFDSTLSFFLPVVPKPIVRHFSAPYIAGESTAEALAIVKKLHAEGAVTTLDILGEFISSPEEADRNAQDYLDLMDEIHSQQIPDCNVSVKPTAMGLLIDRELCEKNLHNLVKRAEAHDSFVRLDMEDAQCTTPTLEIYRALREEFPGRVGAVLQAMLRRTGADIDAMNDAPCNFRLCKGIYLEPHPIAYTDYDIVRRNFSWLLERLFANGAYVGIATHDEMLVFEALRLIQKLGLKRDQYEFQMLLGVQEPLRKILLAQGHKLRVYVPYGSQWYAYSVRRLRENPTIAGHAFKALFRKE